MSTQVRMQVPLSQPSINQDDIDAVLAVMKTPTLSIGPQVRAFEEAIASYTGVAEAVAVNSGTSGLHICLAASGIGSGDEVITSPFSFVASANCAIYQGATPIFADIDPDTLNPAQIEAKITDRTRAIIPVDVFGQPCDIDAIGAIARQQISPSFRMPARRSVLNATISASDHIRTSRPQSSPSIRTSK